MSAIEELTGLPAAERLAGRPSSVRALLASAAFYVALAVLALAAWQVAASFTKPLFLPPPQLVWEALLGLVRDGSLWQHILASYSRILAGWLLGSAVAIPIGLLLGRSRLMHFLLDPYLQLCRFLPAIALISLVILWLGTGENSKIALIMYATAFVVAMATMDGALRVETEKVRAARSLGATDWQVLWLVVVPATVPQIVTGMRLAMTNAFMAIVSAEMLAANEGLGFLIANSRLFMLTEQIFVAIVVLGLLGLATDRAIRIATERLGWRFRVRS